MEKVCFLVFCLAFLGGFMLFLDAVFGASLLTVAEEQIVKGLRAV